MDDAVAVRLVERIGDLAREIDRLSARQRSLLESVRQRLALEVLHDEVRDACRFPNVIERADVRVIERRDALRFALEPCTKLGIGRERGRQHFHGDGALEARVTRLIDLAHAAGADGADDLVGSKARSGA